MTERCRLDTGSPAVMTAADQLAQSSMPSLGTDSTHKHAIARVESKAAWEVCKAASATALCKPGTHAAGVDDTQQTSSTSTVSVQNPDDCSALVKPSEAAQHQLLGQSRLWASVHSTNSRGSSSVRHDAEESVETACNQLLTTQQQQQQQQFAEQTTLQASQPTPICLSMGKADAADASKAEEQQERQHTSLQGQADGKAVANSVPAPSSVLNIMASPATCIAYLAGVVDERRRCKDPGVQLQINQAWNLLQTLMSGARQLFDSSQKFEPV